MSGIDQSIEKAKTGNRWSFLTPSINSYQRQKRVRIVSSCTKHGNKPAHTQNLSQLDFAESESSNLAQTEKWQVFYNERLEAALTCESCEEDPACRTFFPGHTIPSPGGASCHEVYRGSLMYRQFLNLFKFDGGRPDHSPAFQTASLPHIAVSHSEPWLWTQVKRPDLSFIDMKKIADETLQQATQTDFGKNAKEEIYCTKLKNTCYALLRERQLNDGTANFSDLLLAVHGAWSDAPATTYSAESLLCAEQTFNTFQERINDDNFLSVLFELEALASYHTFHSQSQIFASGSFAGNWLAVSLAPLASVHATEFCVRDRLLDEIINLSGQRFAPIIMNEFGSVSDGNHRLTSCWMWNLLKFTSNCNWSLEDDEFQEKVGKFVNEFAEELGPISLHEVLGHLAGFLSNPEQRSRLHNHVKRATSRHGFIFEVPVILLPEYSSSTVVKDIYDDGKAVVRVNPSVYYAMQQDRSLVLPPRASYHFTDSALLPWFSVTTSATNKHQIRSSSARKRTNNLVKMISAIQEGEQR